MSFELPSGRLSQADLDASNQTPVYAAVAVGFVLATGGVILRYIARRKSKSTFDWDDYTIVFALVSCILPYFLPSPGATPHSDQHPQAYRRSAKLSTTLDPSLCARHLQPSICRQVRTGPTSSRGAFDCHPFPEG